MVIVVLPGPFIVTVPLEETETTDWSADVYVSFPPKEDCACKLKAVSPYVFVYVLFKTEMF